MKRRHVKFLLWFVPLIIFYGLAGRYPIWAEKQTRPKRAFDWVLSHGRPTEPRLSRNDKEFLFLVWFADGNFGQGRKYCVAESGRSYGWRLLYDYATQGGDATPLSETTFRVLQKVTLLPQGLSDAHSVSYKRLLVAGLKQGQTWQTCYYDRENLPTEVRQIVTRIEHPDL